MDYTTLNAILTKFGKDKCLQIIFDNDKVMNLCRVKHQVDAINPIDRTKPVKDSNDRCVFLSFDEMVTIDQTGGTIQKKEYDEAMSGLYPDSMYYLAVYPIADIVGFAFIPSDFTDTQAYNLKINWVKNHH